ncbi:MAG: response regulator transcription factor [Rhodoferax sp.]
MNVLLPEDVHAFGGTLLQVYRSVETVPFASFQGHVLEQLRSWLHFRGAIWGLGADVQGSPVPHHTHLHALPQDFMLSWEPVKAEDILVGRAVAQPAHVHSSSLWASEWDDSPRVRARCAQYDIGHVMCVFLPDLDLGLYHFLSLYRGAQDTAFSERDQQWLQWLAPHMVQAADAARLQHLRSLAQPVREERYAIMDAKGVLYQSQPGFVQMLRREWSDWHGPCLPAELVQCAGKERSWMGAQVVVQVDAVKDLYLLRVRGLLALDTLSERERQVAQGFVDGQSHKEVARTLGIAPATVRNHLSAIYTKLAVSDKAQLATAMAGQGLR